MKPAVVDANVAIDLEVAKLWPIVGRLWVCSTPLPVLEKELLPRHPHLAGVLQSVDLPGTLLADVIAARERHPRPSSNDMMCLVLARSQRAMLFTGDKRLRHAATRERVNVRGTIYVIDELVSHGLLTPARARSAYRRLRAARPKRWLPWTTVDDRLRAWGLRPL